MKHSIKISVMALVAMFAFSTAADAQSIIGLGKRLLKKKDKVEVTDSKTGETTVKTTTKGVCEVKNWKTGEMMTVEKLYESMKVLTADEIWGKEKNFRDKEGKKLIADFVIDNEKFENRKRKAESVRKDRKLVQIVFMQDDWQLYRNNLGILTGRSMWINKIFELSNGATMWESIELKQDYAGDNYSDFYEIMGTGNYGYAKDWEHKEDADPLKDL